ncbi:hypothetical protein D0867_03385 [Hortaea werneckii]|uniref:Cysteine-rich transmembrane CYSTM domain-containing protein n=1 Tax=Hortaea werneckii TaxID=91943 RepID=A0A3M7A210_HORWE|nr:hypothetical protein D0867_03385 [Hortaea werneckii]
MHISSPIIKPELAPELPAHQKPIPIPALSHSATPRLPGGYPRPPLAVFDAADAPQGPPPGYIASPPPAMHYDDPRGMEMGGYGSPAPPGHPYGPPAPYGSSPGLYGPGPYGPPMQPPGPYGQPPPGQPMYYQQPPPGGPYGGPPPGGYYDGSSRRGGTGEGICAGILGALACCCCLDFIF